MAPLATIGKRAVLALPFLVLAKVCLSEMDLEKLTANAEPFTRSRRHFWDDGSIPMLWDVFHVAFLDDIGRGVSPAFAPSTFGYDPVAWWQMFSFLVDLVPVYAVWMLEAYHVGNAWSPTAL